MENESDSQIVPDLAEQMTFLYNVKSWGFDKGYFHKDNKELLSPNVETLVMPKKEKCNSTEAKQIFI